MNKKIVDALRHRGEIAAWLKDHRVMVNGKQLSREEWEEWILQAAGDAVFGGGK